MGGRGAKSSGSGSLQSHFERENARVKDFMNAPLKNGYAQIEMDNGQILERYSMEYMKNNVLKEIKANKLGIDDESVSILYKDGSFATYGGGDDTSKMKLSNIEGVIYDNAGTSAYSGKGIKAVNYKELYPESYPDAKGYDDDWRLDFE